MPPRPNQCLTGITPAVGFPSPQAQRSDHSCRFSWPYAGWTSFVWRPVAHISYPSIKTQTSAVKTEGWPDLICGQ